MVLKEGRNKQAHPAMTSTSHNNHCGTVTLKGVCSSGMHTWVVTNSSLTGFKTAQQEGNHAQYWKPNELPT